MGKTNKSNIFNPIEELWKMSPFGTDSIHYPKKSLSVRSLGCVENKDTYTLKLEVNAQNLQSNNASIYIMEEEVLSDEFVQEFYKQTINLNGKTVLTLEIKKSYLKKLSKTDLEGEFEFYAKLFCDGMTVSTNIFRLPAQKTSSSEKDAKKNKNETAVVTFHIYWNSEKEGKIEKHIPKSISKGYEDKIKYVYHDKGGKMHELCLVKLITTKEIRPGNIVGDKMVELIDVRDFKNGYIHKDLSIKFKTFNTETGRYFINPSCFSALLGAMADLNIDFLGFNGFSNYEGKSTGGSKSHRNGVRGDLRYLSTKKDGSVTLLQDSHFDINNQILFNNSLFKYGWASDGKDEMLSENFKYKGNDFILPYCTHLNEPRHNNHLHIQGFDFSIIKQIYE